jgi:hypothetical protein
MLDDLLFGHPHQHEVYPGAAAVSPVKEAVVADFTLRLR